MNLEIRVFEHLCELMLRHDNWRYGQALFNSLYEFAPTVADKIRGTDLDTFYLDDETDETFKNLSTYLREMEKSGKIVQCYFCGRHFFQGSICEHGNASS